MQKLGGGGNTPKLKFGRNVDNDVLNLNPMIGKEILLRFKKKSKMAAKWPTNTF